MRYDDTSGRQSARTPALKIMEGKKDGAMPYKVMMQLALVSSIFLPM